MTEDAEITVGDKVRLKEGGPIMTVRVITGCVAHCIWFPSIGSTQFASFELRFLELAWPGPRQERLRVVAPVRNGRI